MHKRTIRCQHSNFPWLSCSSECSVQTSSHKSGSHTWEDCLLGLVIQPRILIASWLGDINRLGFACGYFYKGSFLSWFLWTQEDFLPLVSHFLEDPFFIWPACLSFPPPPASWCLQKLKGRYVPVTESPEIVYLHPLSRSSFSVWSKNGTYPAPSGHRLSGASCPVWNR